MLMKRFYLILFSVVLAFSGILSANAISITVNVDNPEAVDIKVAYTSIGTVKATNELTVNEYDKVEVVAKTGYRMMGGTNASGTPVGNVSTYDNSWSQWISATNEGDVYNITTKTNEEYRDGSCRIKVDAKDKVRIQRSYTYEVVDNLVDGDFVEVKFNKSQELPLMIQSTTGSPLYQVTLNGQKIPGSSTFSVTPNADTDEIVVEANYPDKDCNVKFVYVNDETSDFITAVTANGTAVENYNAAEGFTVKAGTSLALTGNLSDYMFNSMTVGSETVSYFYGNYNTTVTDNLTITVDVKKYANVTGTISVNIPEAVNVRTSTYDTSTRIPITTNPQEITLSEKASTLYIYAESGYVINSVKANNVDATYNSYDKCYQVTLTEGMSIVVDVTELVRDKVAMVYSNVDPATLTYYSFQRSDRSNITLAKGYNEIKFYDGDNPFNWSWYNGGYVGEVYINDVLNEPTYSGSANYEGKTFNDKDIVKIYFGETNVAKYDVTFNLSGVNASDIDVKKDIITEVTDLAAGFSALSGTQVDITPAEGKNIKVSVNDEAITADNGVYSFNVTAATAVKIEEATGINSISSDDKADNKVYTVQGVRVNNVKNLPAGLYIVNGKTRVVK